MMKFIFITTIVLSAQSFSPAQPVQPEVQRQLDELKTRIRLLENENKEIVAQGRSSDSLRYCLVRIEIFNAFFKASELESDFSTTFEKIAITGLFTRLMQASNPTSDALGFRFSDIVFSSADKHFMSAIKNDQDRKRFSQVLCKIIENPVVNTLANTNPITSVVAAIISTIAGFSSSRLDVDKDGGKIRDINISQEDVISSKNIKAFREDLQVYINFYDALIKASDEYLQGINNVKDKYAYLVKSVTAFRSELYTELTINEDFLVNLTAFLPDPARNDLNYSSLLMNERVMKCRMIASRYPALELEVKRLMTEYNKLLIKFLDDNIKILDSAKDFPEANIDQSKIDRLENEIRMFIKDLEGSGEEFNSSQ